MPENRFFDKARTLAILRPHAVYVALYDCSWVNPNEENPGNGLCWGLFFTSARIDQITHFGANNSKHTRLNECENGVGTWVLQTRTSQDPLAWYTVEITRLLHVCQVAKINNKEHSDDHIIKKTMGDFQEFLKFPEGYSPHGRWSSRGVVWLVLCVSHFFPSADEALKLRERMSSIEAEALRRQEALDLGKQPGSALSRGLFDAANRAINLFPPSM
ncbi:hypothetical protein F4780DRAFT_740190 [Xylariomycetidae sp. FL0641]|nr:hypothetical protein F4780DRAFT_740190 [Xylariomycetidae sp. FL0641]